MINIYDEKEKLISVSLFLIDFLLVTFSTKFTYHLTYAYFPDSLMSFPAEPKHITILAIAIVIYLLIFVLFGFYKTFRHQTLDQVFSKTLIGVFFGVMALISYFFFIDAQEFNRTILGIFTVTSLCFLLLSRSLFFIFLKYFRRRGFNYKNVLIVGSKVRAQEMIDAIFRNPGAGYRVIGCLELADRFVGRIVKNNVKVIGTLECHFKDIIMNQKVDELVFAIPLNEVTNGAEYVTLAEEVGLNIRVLPDWQIQKLTYHPGTSSIFFDQFLGLPTLALSSIPQKETELLLKSVMDYTGAFLLLVATSPIFLLTAAAVRLTSPGPIFFRQVRSGLNGRKIRILKFRSMVMGAEKMKPQLEALNEADGPVFKMKKDPRFTPIGRFIRTMSIDELPQLFNVLKGEMSLVGPRPPIPEEVELYQAWQRRRLSLKPGLTCIWQVKARNNTDFDTWMKLDLEYIDTWSLFLDFKLLLLTIPAVLLATGR